MFLTTPDGPAFLRQVKGLAPGALMLVQVTGYAEPGKGFARDGSRSVQKPIMQSSRPMHRV